VSELQFLGALHVELLRHRELGHQHPRHELFQTSTVGALLNGAFDGDVTLAELIANGDLGLGTLDGLDGELIVIDGMAWKAGVDGCLTQPPMSSTTPYAVVVPFSAGEPVALHGPFSSLDLEDRLSHRVDAATRPTAIRIDGRFATVHVRSVPKQTRPYPSLAEAIAQQQVTELVDVSGSMVGFRFPDPLDGIEMVGAHLHFVTDDRVRGGHVLSYTLTQATAYLDDAQELHVELPPAVDAPAHGAPVDDGTMRRLETDD
jgi:acetolactate decarboxylase